MTIEDLDVVDTIGLHPTTGEVGLMIIDHLEWAEDGRSNKEHLYLLREKVNTYVAFIESGEIYESYPEARGKEPVIIVFGLDPMNQEAKVFFEKIKASLLKAGHKIRFKPLR